MKKVRKLILLLICFMLCLTGCSSDSAYPNQDITVIIPFAAGGGTDLAGRTFVEELAKVYPDVNIVVTNVDGASGTVGASELYNSRADGYTIMVSGISLNVSYEMGIYDKTFENFQPIAQFTNAELGLYVSADSPYYTYEDFATALQEDSDSIMVGVSSGTLNHFATLAIADANGAVLNTSVNTVNELITDLMSGRVDAYVGTVTQNGIYVESGDFRCLGVYGDERYSSMPDVPTFSELGIDMDFTQSFGIWAPIGTPTEIVEELEAAIQTVCESDSYIESMGLLGYNSAFLGTEDYTQALSESLDNISELGEVLNSGDDYDDLLSGTYSVPAFIAVILVLLIVLKLFLKLKNKEKIDLKFKSLLKGKSGIFLLSILAYVIIMEFLGYLISTILFLSAITIYLEKGATSDMSSKVKIRIIVTSVIFAIVTYLFFVYGAKVMIPTSFLGF